LIQRAGIDPVSVVDFYSRPSSTLGNPNFVSGFLGMTGTAPILLYLADRTASRLIFALLSTSLTIFVILDSQSIQGIFAFAFGLAVTFLIVSFRKSKPLAITFGLVFLSVGAVSFAGLLGSGPLSSLLSTTSLLSRFDYWRAAISMTLKNPIFGVGLDGYWDSYRRYRDESALERFGASQDSDTPHNVILDYFTYGGMPLGFAFLALILLVYLKTVKFLLQKRKLDTNALTLFVVLNGYLDQSLVSPNQIGVGVWLWLLLGSMWGIVSKIEFSSGFQSKGVLSSYNSHRQSRFNYRKIVSIVLLLAIPLFYSPLLADVNFLKAAKSGDGLKLISASREWPLDTKRLILVEAAFSSEFNQFKLDTARVGVEHNPNSYPLWNTIFQNPLTPAKLKSKALTELRRLDPQYDSFAP